MLELGKGGRLPSRIHLELMQAQGWPNRATFTDGQV